MCLSVWNRSPKAYEELQSADVMRLPSGRLLQYFKSSIKQNPGFNEEVIELMSSEANRQNVEINGWNGGIIIDEMTIQEDLVMRNVDGEMKLVGLVELGVEQSYMRILETGN